jgi:hypothetical protein
MRNLICLCTLAVLAGAVGCGKSGSGQYIDKRQVQKITCINNLKQVGVAFRLWAGDHDDQYPWNVSTNQGGTREFTIAGKDGFIADPSIQFQVMSNELRSPMILMCPEDRSKKIAPSFTNLNIGNITYRLRMITNSVTDSREVLAVCPVEGNTLFCDGTVASELVADSDGKYPMQVSTNTPGSKHP